MPRWWAWWTASATVTISRAAAWGSSKAEGDSCSEGPAMSFMREVELAIVLADLVDGDDVRVVEPGDGLGLVAEPADLVVGGQRGGPDHLQGDGAVQADLSGLVDDAHAAAAELGLDLVVAEIAHPCAGRQARRWLRRGRRSERVRSSSGRSDPRRRADRARGRRRPGSGRHAGRTGANTPRARRPSPSRRRSSRSTRSSSSSSAARRSGSASAR